MNTNSRPDVAVLIATHNGARYIEQQIESLANNIAPFTLHWLDDHSADDTRQKLREAARRSGIALREWHHPERQGVPGSFFQLLESVDADIYLFCDQDDIWQPGKIDATVENLLPDVGSPALCYSDPLLFFDDEPGVYRRMSEWLHISTSARLLGARSLMATLAAGQAVGLTRPLRDVFLKHKDIARRHALMHCWWMFLLANAVGTARLLDDAPTTLYRQHGRNVTGACFDRSRGVTRIISTWKLQHRWRHAISRQAKGFILASATLTPGPKLEPMLIAAPLVAEIHRRQSLVALLRLTRSGAIVPSFYRMFWLTASCLCTDARLK